MKTCPNACLGTVHLASDKFCTECGAGLIMIPEERCGACGARLTRRMKFCGACGVPLRVLLSASALGKPVQRKLAER